MSRRIGIHQLFIKMADDVSQRSTCSRIQVGSVIVRNHRVISMGWNGVAQGQKHCTEHFEERFKEENPDFKNKDRDGKIYNKIFKEWINSPKIKEEHHDFAVKNEIHSEMNALIFAAKEGISTDGADIYVVWSPCVDCAKAICQAGIKNVYYSNKYERDLNGIKLLESNGISCAHINLEDAHEHSSKISQE